MKLKMEYDNIECVSSRTTTDGMNDDEIHHHHHHNLDHSHPQPHHRRQLSSSKPQNATNNPNSTVTTTNIVIVGTTAIAPATSVHGLLECPVCTNSMYPLPIHQVHSFGQYFCLHLRFMGDEMEARNFSYSLEVGANGRKLIFEGTPPVIVTGKSGTAMTPTRDSHRKVRDSHDGLIIQRKS